MPKIKPVQIAGMSFDTSGAFRDYVKKLLNDLPQGKVVEPHHSFLVELIKRHPGAADKIGKGIDHFKILRNTKYGGRTNSFYLYRLDGTFTDFSYQKCLTAPTPWREFVQAMRGAIMDHIIDAREEAFGDRQEISCPIKLQAMTRSVSHVDHVAPDTFEALLQRFMDEEWIDLENPPATEGGDKVMGRRLVDRDLEERWKYFHETQAKLRVISKEAHLEMKKEKKDGDSE